VKAIVYTKYGSPDVLELKDVKKPAPKDNEVIIRVIATTVSSGDVRMRIGSRESMPFWPISKLAIGITKPSVPIPGHDFAGEIESVGNNVNRFKPGDQVFGFCGKGTYTEYISMPEDGVFTIKPSTMTHEEAVAVPFGATSALTFLRKGNIQSGEQVLIYGASGSVGTAAVQLAKYYGAEVTAVCSTANAELVKSLGADHVIDYTETDFTKNGQTYDVIFDTVGKTSFACCKDSLKQKGRYLLAVFDFPQLGQMLWQSTTGSRKIVCAIGEEKTEDLVFLKELVEAGKFKSVIDRCYALEQINEAHTYVEKGHKKGNVVVTIRSEEKESQG
jgi:2-desacetyl-2-hydroxyethyl bacteriochlorophyllide A dehydrogenase